MNKGRTRQKFIKKGYNNICPNRCNSMLSKKELKEYKEYVELKNT